MGSEQSHTAMSGSPQVLETLDRNPLSSVFWPTSYFPEMPQKGLSQSVTLMLQATRGEGHGREHLPPPPHPTFHRLQERGQERTGVPFPPSPPETQPELIPGSHGAEMEQVFGDSPTQAPMSQGRKET